MAGDCCPFLGRISRFLAQSGLCCPLWAGRPCIQAVYLDTMLSTINDVDYVDCVDKSSYPQKEAGSDGN